MIDLEVEDTRLSEMRAISGLETPISVNYLRWPTVFQDSVWLDYTGYVFKYSWFYVLSANVPPGGAPVEIKYEKSETRESQLTKQISGDLSAGLVFINSTISAQLNATQTHSFTEGQSTGVVAQPNTHLILEIYGVGKSYNVMSLWEWADDYGNSGISWFYRGRVVEPVPGLHVEQTIGPYNPYLN